MAKWCSYVLTWWLAAALTTTARAEVSALAVAPDAANAATVAVHGPHLASYDPAASTRHRLVVFLPGTGGAATQETEFSEALARDGYHVITLDYPNSVTTVTFRPALDRHALDGYRRAVVFGGRVDDTLTVAAADSVHTRITDLVRYLASTRPPNEGWNEYYGPEGVVWRALILAGHSQGAGHAAYVAQRHRVAKVLIIAGPQDYLTTLHQPAPWLSAQSKTPRDRYRVLLHRADEYDSSLQLAAARALLATPRARQVHFSEEPPSTAPAPQILVSERPLLEDERAHRSLMRSGYAGVWSYLLAH